MLKIIHSLLPAVEVRNLREVNVGWNSRVYILNDEFAIKFPKTRTGLRGIQKEMRVTETIRGLIPVEVPRYMGAAGGSDAGAFTYSYIPGKMMTRRELGEGEYSFDPTSVSGRGLYRSIQRQLASILVAVHGVDGNLVREILLEFGEETWKESYERLRDKFMKPLEKAFHGRELMSAKALLEDTIETITSGRFPEKFIHGDFGGWNIIFDEGREKISGLLDWADCRMGDPALDFTELIYDYGEQYSREVLGLYDSNAGSQFMDRAGTYLKLEGYRDLHYGIATDSRDFLEKGKRSIEKMARDLGY